MYRVMLADDEIVIREGIRSNFPWERTEFVLAGEAPDGEIALQMMQEVKPDILVTDIRMPFMDGLTLCREVAAAMPWVHTVILSGYDDFAYAREAISLGVKEYLLKPVSSQELEQVLLRIARRIDEERVRQADYDAARGQLERAGAFLKEGLLTDILFGAERERGELLERAGTLGIELSAPWCRLVLVEADREEDRFPVRAHMQRVADGYGGKVQLCRMGESMAAVILAEGEAALEDRAYAFARAVKHEAESRVGAGLRVAISPPARSVFELSALRASMEDALRAMNAAGGATQILETTGDSVRLDAALGASGGQTLFEKIRFVTAKDATTVLRAHFEGVSGGAFDSMMMMNYLYMDALLTAARVVRESGGDPVAVLPEQADGRANLFTSYDGMEKAAADALRRAMDYRQSHSRSRYTELMRKACAYIEQHFTDPGITLGEVAAQAALSNNHFCTVFSQEMGCTFIEYLTGLRMERAKELLCSSALRASEIAEKVGYNDSHYFGYLFKKTLDMSPREYRNASREKAGEGKA